MALRKSGLIHGELKVPTESYQEKKPSSSAHTHSVFTLSLSKTCQPAFDLWHVISEGGNAQGLGLRYERLSVGGTGRINEVPELWRDGSHHQASRATSARCARNPDDSVKGTLVNVAS